MENRKSAYALTRLPIGVSFFGYGLIRFTKLEAFAQGMAESFNTTFLPNELVLIFAYARPFIEFLIGLLLTLGVAIRKTTVAGVALICILIFGSSLQKNLSAVTKQMFYGLYFSILHLFAKENRYSLLELKK